MVKRIAIMHCVERTSPKGGPFVGRCSLCGQEGLTMADMNNWCPNTANKSQEDALMDAIDGGSEPGSEVSK